MVIGGARRRGGAIAPPRPTRPLPSGDGSTGVGVVQPGLAQRQCPPDEPAQQGVGGHIGLGQVDEWLTARSEDRVGVVEADGVTDRRGVQFGEDTAQLFDALDARSNFEPIMQSVRDLNKLDDS